MASKHVMYVETKTKVISLVRHEIVYKLHAFHTIKKSAESMHMHKRDDRSTIEQVMDRSEW